MKSKRNHLIQCYRGIICIVVIIAHVKPVHNWFYAPFWGIAAATMELFMLIGGYFLYADSEEKQLPRLKRRIRSSFVLAAEAIALYYVLKLAIMLPKGQMGEYYQRYLHPRILFGMIFPNTIGVCGPLWYLVAMFFSIAALYVLIKHKWEEKFLVVTPVLVLICIFLGGEFRSFASSGLFQMDLREYERFFFINSLPFMLYGFLIHRYQQTILERIGKYINPWSLLAVYLLTLAEHQVVGYIGPTFASPFFSLGLFLFALMNPDIGAGSFIEKVGDENSLHIYILHWIFIIPVEPYLSSHSYPWPAAYAAGIGIWLGCIVLSKMYIAGKTLVSERRRTS